MSDPSSVPTVRIESMSPESERTRRQAVAEQGDGYDTGVGAESAGETDGTNPGLAHAQDSRDVPIRRLRVFPVPIRVSLPTRNRRVTPA